MTRYGTLAEFSSQLPRRVAAGGVNATLLLNRIWISSDETIIDERVAGGKKITARAKHLRLVAEACNRTSSQYRASLHARRDAALTRLRANAEFAVMAVDIIPAWRIAVGIGENSASENSLAMSAIHGLPIIPGSALKGTARSHARDTEDPDLVDELFGAPRPQGGTKTSTAADAGEEKARMGAVRFFDAIPTGAPLTVVVDVLTPHVKPYYDNRNRENPTGPIPLPGDYHDPVPVQFLAVQTGVLRTLLAGEPTAVELAADALCAALDERGIGGKTNAGYGYCTTDRQELS